MDKSKTEERVCVNCGCELEDGDGTAYGIGEICNHCLEYEFHHCDNCGRLIHGKRKIQRVYSIFL